MTPRRPNPWSPRRLMFANFMKVSALATVGVLAVAAALMQGPHSMVVLIGLLAYWACGLAFVASAVGWCISVVMERRSSR